MACDQLEVAVTDEECENRRESAFLGDADKDIEERVKFMQKLAEVRDNTFTHTLPPSRCCHKVNHLPMLLHLW